ncbi:MAG: dihydropteroate synthase [Bacteroidales bacterium]|nr:dihydropteroate synthase [Bacteroidales bacterium]
MKNFSTTGTLFSRNYSLNLNGQILNLSTPRVMGIINATPDSFYQGSRLHDPSQAVKMASEMLDRGASILDVGAVSSRPGAEEISEEDELNRLSPVLEALRNELPECSISVDTWRSGVAKTVHQRFGIDMINDISAGQLDPAMFTTVAGLGIPYVMMHMQGTPDSMQEAPAYENLLDDLLQFFGERIYKLRKLGVNDIVVDPGFGFGKTLEQNYKLLQELDAFRMLELPLMVGISRKSMIYKALNTDPLQALNGTTAAHMAALLNGASILRVHDVRAAVETVKIFQQIVNSHTRGV